MDLGTIRSSINRMKYSCNNEVLEDIRLVFENCRLYNKEEAEEYQCGERLERYAVSNAHTATWLLMVQSRNNVHQDIDIHLPSKHIILAQSLTS